MKYSNYLTNKIIELSSLKEASAACAKHFEMTEIEFAMKVEEELQLSIKNQAEIIEAKTLAKTDWDERHTYSHRSLDWQWELKDKCSKCGEEQCEYLYTKRNSKIKHLCRDCDQLTYLRLPKYLRDEIGLNFEEVTDD